MTSASKPGRPSVDELRREIFDGVLASGIVIRRTQVVPGGRHPASYTVGRTLRQRPELVISGLPENGSESLLRIVANLDDSATLAPGELIPLPSGNTLRVMPAEPAIALDAVIAFVTGVTVLQVQWLSNGVYPGDPGFEPLEQDHLPPGMNATDPYGGLR